MASDFGDESGEKLFDWFLRMGQDMSEEALRASAERLKGAIQNLRGNLEDAAPQQDEEVREFARLDMSEFEELPDYESLKAIIGERLDDAAIEHDFAKVDGHDHLVFRHRVPRRRRRHGRPLRHGQLGGRCRKRRPVHGAKRHPAVPRAPATRHRRGMRLRGLARMGALVGASRPLPQGRGARVGSLGDAKGNGGVLGQEGR